MKTEEKTLYNYELPTTMRAAHVHHFGGPEVICIDSISIPWPDHGEVLVRVTDAGVGPWDGWIRSGNSVLTQPLPLTLGSDLSGIITRIGPDVLDFKVGDTVFGDTNKKFTGAHAEYAIAQASMIALKPTSINETEAASLPVIAVTAWQAPFDHASLKFGHKILIHGGAGGVGAYGVQFRQSCRSSCHHDCSGYRYTVCQKIRC